MDISLTRLPWYGQLGAFMALGLVAVGGFYYYYEVPERAAIAVRASRLQELQAEVAKAQTISRTLPAFESDVNALESRLTALRAVLPEEKDAADLLRAMQAVAMQSNLTIKTFRPAPVETKQLHAEWPINLELDGTYHNLALFFDRIGRFSRIVNISGLSVQGREPGPGGATITAACVATTFVLIEKPAAPPGAAVPAAPAVTAADDGRAAERVA